MGPLIAAPAVAQQWNDARVTELVNRATERRARQLADTGLTTYTATALGSLTFLAQVGEGFPDPPKVVKADQIALDNSVRILKVAGFSERRGDASSARVLYEDLQAPPLQAPKP